MKNNRGVTLTDVILGIIILSLFVGVIGNLFYQIIFNTNLIRYNAVATFYAVRIAEEIDKMSYENVTNSNIQGFINQNFEIPEGFSIDINISNYNKNDESKLDILKIANIKVNYSLMNTDFDYQIEKLKVKEF